MARVLPLFGLSLDGAVIDLLRYSGKAKVLKFRGKKQQNILPALSLLGFDYIQDSLILLNTKFSHPCTQKTKALTRTLALTIDLISQFLFALKKFNWINSLKDILFPYFIFS